MTLLLLYKIIRTILFLPNVYLFHYFNENTLQTGSARVDIIVYVRLRLLNTCLKNSFFHQYYSNLKKNYFFKIFAHCHHNLAIFLQNSSYDHIFR